MATLPKRRAFSLVLSLMLMAALAMMVILLVSFLQIESRLTTANQHYTKARLNALVASKLAVAQLQTLAGHDQRVTARADLMEAAAPGTKLNTYLTAKRATTLNYDKRWWTGVWCTGGADQSKVRDWLVSNPDDRLFLGYLVSADPATGQPINNMTPSRLLKTTEVNEMNNALRNAGTATNSATSLVTLVGYGTVAPEANYDGRIKIPPLPLNSGNKNDTTLGNYAWWTGDESVKAKINLGETYTKDSDSWKSGLLLSSARRNGTEMLGGLNAIWPNYKNWFDTDANAASGAKLGYVTSAADLANWAVAISKDPSGRVDKLITDGIAKYYGDITLKSYGVLSDVYNGGLKTDLSLAFELPHEDYKLLGEFHDSPGAPGDRNWLNLVKEFGFTATNTPSFAEWGDPNNKLGFVFEAPIPNLTSGPSVVPKLLGNTPASTYQSPSYVTRGISFTNDANDYASDDWTVRGPTWLLVRNFYRLYKRELETTGARGQPKSAPDAWFARGAEPFTYSSGVTGWNCFGDPNGSNYTGEKYNAGILHHKGRISSSKAGNWILSTFQPHQFASVWWSSKGGMYPQPTAMKIAPVILRHTQRWGVIYNQDTLGVTFDPILTIHNPYNVALEFTGIGAYFNKYYPVAMAFTRVNTTTGNEELLNLSGLDTNGVNFTNGVFYPHDYNFTSRAFAVRWVAPQGTTLRLEAGEVAVIGSESSVNNSLKTYSTSVIAASRNYNPDKSRHYFKLLLNKSVIETATNNFPLRCRMYANWMPTATSNGAVGYWDGAFFQYNLMHYQRDNGSTTYPLEKIWAGQNYAESDGSEEALINRTGFFTAFYPDAVSGQRVLAQKTISQTGEFSGDGNIERTYVGVLDLRWRTPLDTKEVHNFTAADGRGLGAGTGSPLVADSRYDATDPRDWDADSMQSPPMLLKIHQDPGIVTPVDMNASNQGYYGHSYNSSGGRTRTVQFEIPQRPLTALTGLGHIQFGTYATQPAYTVGNSYVNIGLPDANKTLYWPNSCVSPAGKTVNGTADFGTDNGNTSTIRTDSAFLMNLALWDRYFFSGLNVSMPNVARNTFHGGDSTRESDPNVIAASKQLATPADVWDQLATGSNPLANPRLIWGRYCVGRTDDDLRNDFYRKPTSTPRIMNEVPARPERVAKQFLYDGSFNVNSTSKEAWRLVLAGMRNADATGTHIFSRFNLPPNTPNNEGSDNHWGQKYASLTDDEIDRLATNIVAEVHRRGPFMSLADFVNRRLTNQVTGMKGPLQAAIDATNLNDYALKQGRMRDDFATKVTTPGGRFPQAKAYDPAAYSTASNDPNSGAFPIQSGANTHLLQMQLLQAIGSSLTVRGDTFTVRAYGDSLDEKGQVVGRAWMELTVQRLPELFIPDDREPTVALGALPNNSTIQVPKGNNTMGANDGSGGGFGGYRSPLITNYGTDPIMERWVRNKDALTLNQLFGRRFQVTAVRWLRDNEI